MASIIGVETLQHTNGTTAATIDSSGRVLQPAKVMFQAFLPDVTTGYTTGTPSTLTVTSTALSFSAKTEWACVDTHINNGSHYSTSTGRFTAPVNGTYKFWYGFLGDYTANSVDRIHTELRKNGVDNSLFGTETYSPLGSAAADEYAQVSGSILVPLNANDYVSIWIEGGFHNRYSGWGGELVG